MSGTKTKSIKTEISTYSKSYENEKFQKVSLNIFEKSKNFQNMKKKEEIQILKKSIFKIQKKIIFLKNQNEKMKNLLNSKKPEKTREKTKKKK